MINSDTLGKIMMNQISITRLMSALYDAFTHPLTLIVFSGVGVYAAYKIITTRAQSTSITATVTSFYQLMGKGKWSQIWSNLSPVLKNLLLDEDREVVTTRGYTGTGQLKHLASIYHELFQSSRPVFVSKHRVPNTQLGTEMIMIHTRHHVAGHGVTFWLVRKVHSQGYWMIEEVLIHPKKGTPSYTLSGKRFVPPKTSQTKSEGTADSTLEATSETNSDMNLNNSAA